jgi:hypothetical protein
MAPSRNYLNSNEREEQKRSKCPHCLPCLRRADNSQVSLSPYALNRVKGTSGQAFDQPISMIVIQPGKWLKGRLTCGLFGALRYSETMETNRRPREVWYFTVPVTVAKSVSSPPLPTPVPG